VRQFTTTVIPTKAYWCPGKLADDPFTTIVTPAQAGVHLKMPRIKDGPSRASVHSGALVHRVRQIQVFAGMTNSPFLVLVAFSRC
jgi:hypothetical protein